MKTLVPFLLTVLLCGSVSAQNTNLPNPSSNNQTLPAGSYVIPMDNSLQTNNVIGSGTFNLASYGLVVHLLNNNVKVKWVIKAGKVKDGIDFTANARLIQPTYISANSSRDFISGPFVIFAQDTTGVAALVNSFYTSKSLTGNNRPKVFQISSSVANVDIRYDLTGFKPKAAVLTDGGNKHIHTGYFAASSISAANYDTAVGSELLTKCFTFASEPHNGKSGAVVDATISAIKRFVGFGGNFLAQCEAVENYENNILGRFQTSTGITKVNIEIGTNLSYPNADLSFSQFHGLFNASDGGSVKNWIINNAATNNEHNHATGTGGNANVIGASVSKMKSGSGGLVFYIGNHDFKVSDGETGINGIRMYMNAFLTPVSINNNCSIGTPINPLPVKLTAFNASLSTDQSKVKLTWTTAQEINASHFVVERSVDGNTFNDVGMVFAFGNSTEVRNYEFADNVKDLNATIIYYRLRQVDIDEKVDYSATRIVRVSNKENNTISILAYPNPVSNEVRVTIPTDWQNKVVVYEVFNMSGQIATKVVTANSGQTEVLNVSKLNKGMYIIRAICEGKTAQQKIIKQ